MHKASLAYFSRIASRLAAVHARGQPAGANPGFSSSRIPKGETIQDLLGTGSLPAVRIAMTGSAGITIHD
jgi:hypothetical protein